MAQAIEALLAGDSASPAQPLAAPCDELTAALAALEQRVALLEQARRASPVRASAPSPVRAMPDPPIEQAPSPDRAIAGPLPDRRLTPAEADGLLTTPQVAEVLGLASQSALTNWIARQGGNGVGGVYRGYRLRGKALLPGGQKPGWLWELAG